MKQILHCHSLVNKRIFIIHKECDICSVFLDHISDRIQILKDFLSLQYCHFDSLAKKMVALGRNTYSGARLLELVLVNCSMLKLSSNYKSNNVKILEDIKKYNKNHLKSKYPDNNYCYYFCRYTSMSCFFS